ncbi:hypothetical protein [Peterkaempfera griseoplana]|uniref:hypothetical protein n=1 Tax=Peterkaempfera griseoplana TaxID=66896 RepID=UPI0006E16092|nr:hypothetical protein [Peterkaempfera griseoplana]
MAPPTATPSRTTTPRRAPVDLDTVTRGSFRKGLLVGAAAVLVLALATALLVAFHPAHPADRTKELADRIRAQDAARNKQQVKELTDQARKLAATLGPVLQQMEHALPHDGGTPRPADTAETARWKKVTSQAVTELAHPPSGDTGYNIARADLAAAVRALDGAVDTYRLLRDAPASLAHSLRGSAAAQRDQGVDTWSIGATALDVAGLDAGLGHQHVFLAVTPDGQALSPDDQPEGSEAR